ncbi:MAG: aspartate-semialdehyde dehydrogenase [bacterium]|nr:aspartate-semialdehyde dehydrogenase [bacterium]
MERKERYNVAVAGATGAVGREMISILEDRKFPVGELKLLASERSVGMTIPFRGRDVSVEQLEKNSFDGVDIALFSAGASRSLEFSLSAVKSGAVVIDNSSAFRTDPEIPLVVPEVNARMIPKHHGIIANPNCSTIQMVVALKPIYDVAGIRRIVVTTFQAVSGTGQKAIDELLDQTKALFNFQDVVNRVYPHQIAFNCLPHIDVFQPNGYSKEEMKMVHETRKILGDDSIGVTATAVRIPVFRSHSESINIETKKKITAHEARELLAYAEGVCVLDDPFDNVYPLAIDAAGKDETFVGRIREDESIENGLNLWVVSDNLRKGAALNTVQIAEQLVGKSVASREQRP